MFCIPATVAPFANFNLKDCIVVKSSVGQLWGNIEKGQVDKTVAKCLSIRTAWGAL